MARRMVVGKMLIIGFPPCSKLSSLTPMMPADDPWRIGGGAIHRSAWNRNSANFAFWGFSEVELRLNGVLRRSPQEMATLHVEIVHPGDAFSAYKKRYKGTLLLAVAVKGSDGKPRRGANSPGCGLRRR